MLLVTAAIVLLFLLNLVLGSVDIPVADVLKVLTGSDSEVDTVSRTIILKSRLPQALTAIMAGAGLAVSGLLMQTAFHNPLAGPSVLGISSGASLGVAFVVLLSGSIGGAALSRMGAIGSVAITVSAIIGSLLVMALIAYTARKVRGNVTLLIMGVMIGYLANAIIGVLKFFSAEEDIRAYVVWGLGSFARVSGGETYVFVVLMLCLLPTSFLLAKALNLMLLGDSYARNLGLDTGRARMQVIVCSGVLVAVVTAYCGPIMFLGLAVPHLCRGLFRTSNHAVLLPASLLAGAALALLCNLIARLPGFEGALPVNSVTALIGAPVVMWVLFKKQKSRVS
ncbi:MAG: iron ABC transporter permease [Muribaculaceae bacterium]|nr:iron ABC transporter permease [Muribaculaceae bacterium]